MKDDKKKIYIHATLFTLIICGFYFIPPGANTNKYVNNAMYQWDNPIEGYIALDQTWQFKRGVFTLDDWDESEIVKLPETWQNQFGFGSYRLILTGLDSTQSYSFLLPYEATAYSFYVNYTLFYQNGKPGSTRELSIPGYAPGQITIPPGFSTFEIILHISNFHHRRGGPFQIIYMGKPNTIRALDTKAILTDGALVITYITMSLYLFTLFILRRKKSILFLGLFFMLAGINNLFGTPNVLLFRIFPLFPWFVYQKLCYYISYLLPIILLMFSYSLYGMISSRMVRFFISIYVAIFLFVTLTPPQIFSLYNSYFQIFTLYIFGLILSIFTHAVAIKLPGARGVLIGHIILCLIMFSSIMFSNDRISQNTYMPLAFLEYYQIYFSQNFSITLTTWSYILTLLLINLLSLVFFIKAPVLKSFTEKNKLTVEIIANWGNIYSFSPRENQIALWLIKGKTNKEISEGLFISLSTVKTHISRIFKKTRVESRAELFFLYQEK